MKCELIYRQIIGSGFELVDIDDGVYLFKRVMHQIVERICMDSNGNIYRGKTIHGVEVELSEVVK